MSPLMDRKLRFSDAVYAIGTSPTTLRNWLQRNQIQFPGGQSETGWREFSYADIAVLAVVAKLVQFGIRVEVASALATEIHKNFPMLFTHKNTPPRALAAVWVNRAVKIWPEGNSMEIRVIDPGHSPVDRYASGEDVNAAIFLDMEPLLRTAFARADESTSDGNDA